MVSVGVYDVGGKARSGKLKILMKVLSTDGDLLRVIMGLKVDMVICNDKVVKEHKDEFIVKWK